MGELHSLHDLLGSSVAWANIPPPANTLADWERYLRAVSEIALVDGDGKPSMFAQIIRRRVNWLREARRRGIDYETAERAWEAGSEREHDALLASVVALEKQRAQARRERDRGTKGKDSADEIFGHARETGL